MTAIVKSAKRHPAAKKCCGWEEPAIWCLAEPSAQPKLAAKIEFGW